MRVSYKWLKELVELPLKSEDLVKELVRTGTEVEAVETLGQQFDNIVTAQIISKQAHPDSDHMWVCMVDVGEEEPLQIVCGAQNFEAGDHIVTAKIGAVLPGDFKIKKSKLRGVLSCGMNCSYRELGLGDDHEGIIILPKGSPIGMPFAQYQGLGDEILELEITPNRPDCLSMYGMAREAAAALGTSYSLASPTELGDFEPSKILEEASKASVKNANGKSLEDLLDFKIEDETRAYRYTAKLLHNVKLGPSPAWLQERLNACGCRSINNVVDVTNYVMFLLGQPLHAFDWDKLCAYKESERLQMSVRAAHEGECLQTLDGVQRSLNPDMSLIAVGDKGVALAGVMGGQETEVTENTSSVLLESAVFSSAHTSRTSRNLQLFSESSIRYERGVDAQMSLFALEYAAALLVKLAEAEPVASHIDVYPVKKDELKLLFRADKLRAFVGAEISDQESCAFLEALGCKLNALEEPHHFEVVVPSFRPDLTREIDLYEEVLRLWGMQRVPSSIPAARGHWGGLSKEQQIERKIGQVMRALGLNETITYSLVSPHDLASLGLSEEGRGFSVELLNPMSEEQSVLRRSLLPGMLRNLAYNQAHGVKNVQLYEEGSVFYGQSKSIQPKEKRLISAVLFGSFTEKSWNQEVQELGFFDMKGILESLVRELCIQKARFRVLETKDTCLQPGRAAELLAGSSSIGFFGELHPKVAQAFDLEGPIAVCELDLDLLIKHAQERRPYVDVPKLPAVELDFALVVDEEMSAERLEQMIKSAGNKLLESVRLFDVYRDEQRLGKNKKSLAFKLVYRSDDHTLSSEEVEKAHSRVVDKVSKAAGASLRSS